MHPRRFATLAPLPLVAAAAIFAPGAQSQELYTKAGVPGVLLGWAQPLTPHLGARVDVATIGTRTDRRNEDGIDYDGKLKADRAALLMDLFPFAGSFRVSAGITSNRYKLDLLATGAGGTVRVGNTTYTTTANDKLAVAVKFPSSTPYLGIGWGHQRESGLRFSFDIGAMIGKAKVSYELSGPWAARVSQQDIDAELAELRDGVGKVKAIPQITFGLGYSF